MEDVYILINDCVFYLSSQFTFDILLQLSTTSKYNSKLIYELTIHDHDNQPIYHTSTNQIKKFHNIDTLTISKYYNFHLETNNLTNLIHIKNIKFHDEQHIPFITKLTQLTSCNFVRINSIPTSYFHTALTRLYVFNSSHKILNVQYVFALTHLTHIDARNNRGYVDVEQFLGFKNLKSLIIPFVKNLSKLSELISLQAISIHNDYIQHPDIVVISHPTVTNIEIYDCVDFKITNCHKLKYLKLTDWINCFLDDNILQLHTLILNARDGSHDYDMNINFDINRCISLEYLEYSSAMIQNLTYLEHHLTKLNSLYLGYNINIRVDDVVANNLTYLSVNNNTNILDLNKYRNLKQLSICYVQCSNLDKLVELEYLNCEDENNSFQRHYINCMNHRKLTYLCLQNQGIINLSNLSKLNRLILHNIDYIDLTNIWNNDIKYLFKLTFLYIHKSYETSLNATKGFDISCLANPLNLKCLGCNFLLNDLNLLDNVNYLNITYHKSYSNIISKLTKLNTLYISSNEKIDKMDVRSLKRLNNFYQHESNLIFPEITMIE